MEQSEMGRLLEAQIAPGWGHSDPWWMPAQPEKVESGQAMARVVYMSGGPGSGKTFYVQKLLQWAQHEGLASLYTPAQAVEMSPEGVARFVLEALQTDSRATTATLLEMVRVMNRTSDHRGLVWALDDYDQWYPVDRWLREQVFPLMSPRIVWVLAGSERVRGHWLGDATWLARVSTVTIQPLDVPQITQLADNAGIREPEDIALVTKLSQGNPKVLQTLVHSLAWLKSSDALVQNRVEPHVSLFLIEQMLHPGSRRLRWRAGWGNDSVDTLVAVASLVRWFDRRLLAEVLDSNLVRKYWDELIAFPLVIEHAGGIYQMAPDVRAPIQEGLGCTRPWSQEWWRRRWLKVLIRESSGERASLFEDQITALVQDILFPVNVEDCRGGHWILSEENPAVRHYVIEGHNGAPAGRLTVEHDLKGRDLQVRAIELSEWWALPRLFRVVLALLPQASQVRWEIPGDMPSAAREMTLAYLHRMGFADTRDEAGHLVNHLDLSAGYLAWAQEVVKPRAGDLPPTEQLVDWVQQALHAVRDAGTLRETSLYRLAGEVWGTTSADRFQLRLLDALRSADLGEWPEGGDLLYRYYVERAGSHEFLAECFHVSRATYFRSHRRAIQRLTEALFFLAE